jgi:sugar/nucleoside kinase (ribokinase family)
MDALYGLASAGSPTSETPQLTVDVVCVADPYLDLIFRGLPSLPVAGTEQNAASLVVVPGGIANVAYALGRLGLAAIICAPRGQDPAGRFLAELVADAGVTWVGRASEVTPVTVSLPAGGDRALVSVMPPPTVDVETLSSITARAAVVDLPSLPLLASPTPAPMQVYAVVGDPEVDMLVGRPLPSLHDLHALILNEREASRLTGQADAEVAAAHLASLGTTVVVTRGPLGAIATEPDGRAVAVSAVHADVVDATGAGDLFIAAYIWADLAGHPIEERLRLAASYASLSLGRANDRQKGITLRELEDLLAP